MRSVIQGIGALACAVALVGCSSLAHSSSTEPLPSGTVAANAMKTTATVKKIDQKSRKVTIERADGSHETFVAGDGVRNLAQVKAGDQISVTYYESLAYEVKKPGQAEPGGTLAAGMQRAPLGEKPAGTAAQAITITSTISAIDKKAGTATLRDTEGEEITVKVRNPANLDRVSVGDLVELTYTEALAISIEKP